MDQFTVRGTVNKNSPATGFLVTAQGADLQQYRNGVENDTRRPPSSRAGVCRNRSGKRAGVTLMDDNSVENPMIAG